jgi:metallophosphoesterase (TIGR00282 family)
VRILFLGDVVGKAGRRLLASRLPELQRDHEVDFTIVNAENAAGGKGVTADIADELLACGADVLTSGNHVWAQRGVEEYLASEPRLIRPANFPGDAPGAGLFFGRDRRGRPVGVLNLQGRLFMQPIDCPFAAFDAKVAELAATCKTIIVDFHAEATSEKLAMGWYADGRVTAVIGTHTHVPTADARVLPDGTAYCTDVGMCGPYESVIGTVPDLALTRFLTARPVRFAIADGDVRLAGALIRVDPESGRAVEIARLLDPPDGFDTRV